ncbi:Serine/threonine-protein kinase PknB [Rubripirellula tenax]|uniref:non-specific serine/threonine protein kinase n=1 Tax=Rubripirellula tenax TaxID=2528015 RepID=A0A5C6F9F4_9BACT|nr:serine/threonine-protein kinase [Rubripirellula tenax]TWU57077.1 Serine/threonine-protein kinase PknB [Rubripirellula tenax]
MSDDRDQRLADILSEVTDAICRGEIIDIQKVYVEHPDLSGELKRLLGAVLVTDTAGSARDEGIVDDSAASQRWRSLQLPTTVGDYELIEELGRGGMGVVFRARQISLNREVAVKMILRGRLASESDLNRFMAEASATAKLEHSGIVPVYEVGDVDGRPFFSMQLVDGATLAELVADGPLPQRRAAQIVAEIARAIGFAHRHGVLHRDLKPSNILITGDGTAMVTDFGLAKQITDSDELTRSGMLLGTPAYMSPEQASGRRGLMGPASDVYSLGCVLYFALTGRPPFVAESPMELVMLVIEQEPAPPRAIRPNLDRDLEMIAIRCLQKPIDLRYESADALANDLDAYLADEKVAARSGRFGQVVARLFRETHHAAVLENWGILWIWHSIVLLVACMLTWQLDYNGIEQRWIYAAVWTVGLGAWATVFWSMRQRMGPVTFIERQVAHVWGASMIAIGLLFPLEWWLKMPVLSLSPMLGIVSAMVFIVKAGMFNGTFYLQAAALLAVSALMALQPGFAHFWFGLVAWACFFVPGYKYARRRRSYRER